MKHFIFLMASILVLASCSKDELGTNGFGNGETYVLDFSSGKSVNTRAGSSNLKVKSNVSVSVFSGATGSGASTFIDTPYLVTEDAKLAYRNDLKLTGKQGIVSVSPGAWSTYASAVNDGDYMLTLSKNSTTESLSTYATENGYEYVFAKAENKTVTADAASRKITMTFNRQVAMVVFTVVAGSGLVALPNACTTSQKVESPKMKLPVRESNDEGLLEVTKGITKPLTKMGTTLDNIYANAVGENFGFYYYLLPLSITNKTTFDVQFQLKVAETGSGLGALRTFDVKNVELPVRTDKNYGFDMGKQYNYTVTVTNTGLYLSDVTVVDWVVANQGNLPAQ